MKTSAKHFGLALGP